MTNIHDINPWIVGHKDFFTIAIGFLTLSTGLIAAVIGLRTYRKNATTRRVEFLVDLHKDFFVESKYRAVRTSIDHTPKDEKQVRIREQLVSSEDEDFIEYLNFFELVAYLNECGNLSDSDVNALLGYYLRLLISHDEVYAYINDVQRNGFKHLKPLLAKIEKAGKSDG